MTAFYKKNVYSMCITENIKYLIKMDEHMCVHIYSKTCIQ